MTPEEKSKKGKASRLKGHNFERAVAILLRPLWAEAKRGYQSRFGTKAAPDVDHTPFYIECKAEKSTNPKKALEQAREGSDGRPPLAITRDTSGPILVTMDLELFLHLNHEIERLKSELNDEAVKLAAYRLLHPGPVLSQGALEDMFDCE